MQIENCHLEDIDSIIELYDAARALQREKNMLVWPYFDRAYIQKEVEEQRQWKIMYGETIVCIWAITLEDKQIWGERDRDDAVYIHRIVTHPHYRGRRFIDTMVTWAKAYANHLNRRYIRLDTFANNTALIRHYLSAGFRSLGIFRLGDTRHLPLHYQEEPNRCLLEMEAE
jgi:RimJ/RimL family protein N-acetyltransferase